MRDVAIVSFAHDTRKESVHDDVEMLVPVIGSALAQAGLTKNDIGFTVSGSCDYLGGRPFSFVMAFDALGAWPPIQESHVEMDGAFALYEAWVRLQHGDIDAALVYAFGRSSGTNLREVLVSQLDPYVLAPLKVDDTSLAALQARALLDQGRVTERDLATVVARNHASARKAGAPHAPDASLHATIEGLLQAPYVATPLRAHDCPPSTDGCAAIVLVAGDSALAEKAKKLCKRPAWITGIDHRIEAHQLGTRDLTTSSSTTIAAKKAGAYGKRVDVAELHAPFSHQELILRDALELSGDVDINPSGGATGAHPFIVAGLNRIGEAARRVIDGSAESAIAHATSGPCLQQNLVCVLEATR
jgi:acetyl-CoA acetyltransferase